MADGSCSSCEGCRVAGGSGSPDSADTRLLTTRVLGRVALSHLFLLSLLELKKYSFYLFTYLFAISFLCVRLLDTRERRIFSRIMARFQIQMFAFRTPFKQPTKCERIILFSEKTLFVFHFARERKKKKIHLKKYY